MNARPSPIPHPVTPQTPVINAGRGAARPTEDRVPARPSRAEPDPGSDPGAIEYASWLRLLRRPAP